MLRTTTVTFPELTQIAATRVMLGVGVGLLLSDYLRPEHRRPAGWTLFAVGVLSTIPLAAMAISRSGGQAHPFIDEAAR